MSRTTAELTLPIPDGEERDPDFEVLPEPRRPGRKLTLACMVLTACLSLLMVWSLRNQVAFALSSGPPTDLQNLAHAELGSARANSWVRGEALLVSNGAVRYGRPLESDTYRLARVAGNERLWVEIRVPEGMEGPHFVPPTSFVGRLVPLDSAGIHYSGLQGALADAGNAPPEGSWLLVDGAAPSTSRWALGLVALFIGFALFNLYGIVRILRPVRDD